MNGNPEDVDKLFKTTADQNVDKFCSLESKITFDKKFLWSNTDLGSLECSWLHVEKQNFWWNLNNLRFLLMTICTSFCVKNQILPFQQSF